MPLSEFEDESRIPCPAARPSAGKVSMRSPCTIATSLLYVSEFSSTLVARQGASCVHPCDRNRRAPQVRCENVGLLHIVRQASTLETPQAAHS
jgi:hypothetical protein